MPPVSQCPTNTVIIITLTNSGSATTPRLMRTLIMDADKAIKQSEEEEEDVDGQQQKK